MRALSTRGPDHVQRKPITPTASYQPLLAAQRHPPLVRLRLHHTPVRPSLPPTRQQRRRRRGPFIRLRLCSFFPGPLHHGDIHLPRRDPRPQLAEQLRPCRDLTDAGLGRLLLRTHLDPFGLSFVLLPHPVLPFAAPGRPRKQAITPPIYRLNEGRISGGRTAFRSRPGVPSLASS